MSFTAVLCHFCEKEGPTVLLTTSVDTTLRRPGDADESALLENLNSLPEVQVSLSSIKSSCEFCHSLSEQVPFIVSWPADAAARDETARLPTTVNEKVDHLTFVSSRLPPGACVIKLFFIVPK
jgi:hypothetical protein